MNTMMQQHCQCCTQPPDKEKCPRTTEMCIWNSEPLHFTEELHTTTLPRGKPLRTWLATREGKLAVTWLQGCQPQPSTDSRRKLWINPALPTASTSLQDALQPWNLKTQLPLSWQLQQLRCPEPDKTKVIWGSQDKSTGLLICAFFLPFQTSPSWR